MDWVLAGSGSLSSGSARSHGQLIAAQRLDPQSTLFPKTDDKSAARVRKGNPWTERKEIVALGVGVRTVSAGRQQLALNDPENSSVSVGHFILLCRLHNCCIVEYGIRLIMSGFLSVVFLNTLKFF